MGASDCESISTMAANSKISLRRIIDEENKVILAEAGNR